MLWYLDLGGKALTLVASILLPKALCDLGGLVHPKEPVVTVVDVHNCPQVTAARLQVLILLVTLL